MPDGTTTSPTSFGEALRAPAPDVYTTARDALAALAQQPHISEGFRQALSREIAELDHQAREAARYRGVSPSGLGPDYREPRTLEALVVDGEELEARRREYLASPIGKARGIIAKACRVCELNDWREAYAALDAVGAALSRGSGAERFVEAAQVKLAALPEGDAKVAVLLLGTELLLAVRAVA